MAERSSGVRRVFDLGGTPEPATSAVSVDSTPSTTGWTYANGRVTFDAASVPAEGSTVRIDYTARCQ